MTASNPEIRLAEPGEEEACNAFHNQALGVERTQRQWEWEFRTEFAPRPLVAVVIWNGRIYGTQALIPVKMIDREGTFLAAKSEETLVDPTVLSIEPRSFGRMYDLLFRHAEELRLQTIWGFTARQKAFERVGFSAPTRLRSLRFPSSARRIARWRHAGREPRGPGAALAWTAGAVAATQLASFRLRLRALSHNPLRKLVHLQTLQRAPVEAEDLSRSFIDRFGGTTLYRDQSYLERRVFANPFATPTFRAAYLRGRLVGWIAYAIDHGGVGSVVDVFAGGDVASDDVRHLVDLLICDATSAMQRSDVVAVNGCVISDHPLDVEVARRMRAAGYFAYGPPIPMVVKNLGSRTSLADIDSWYVNLLWSEGRGG
jgi:hypothetical protein